MDKSANISGEFEKNVMKLLKRKASGYKGTGMLAGGLLGGGAGGLLGVANTARQQMSGELDDLSPEEKMQKYMSNAARFGTYGAAAGGGLGLLKGLGNRGKAIEQQMEHMRPFLAEQLAGGVRPSRLLSKVDDLANMHSSAQLGKFTDKGVFDNIQEGIGSMRAPEMKGNMDDFMSSGGILAEDAAKSLAKEEAKDAKALSFLGDGSLWNRVKATVKGKNSPESYLLTLRKELATSKAALAHKPNAETIKNYNDALGRLSEFNKSHELLVASRRNPSAMGELTDLAGVMEARNKTDLINKNIKDIIKSRGTSAGEWIQLFNLDPEKAKQMAESMKLNFDTIKDLAISQRRGLTEVARMIPPPP
jgi:hypothetical protein